MESHAHALGSPVKHRPLFIFLGHHLNNLLDSAVHDK